MNAIQEAPRYERQHALEDNCSSLLSQAAAAAYADARSSMYRRGFTPSGELETEKVEPNLRNGALTLHIPKRPELSQASAEARSRPSCERHQTRRRSRRASKEPFKILSPQDLLKFVLA